MNFNNSDTRSIIKFLNIYPRGPDKILTANKRTSYNIVDNFDVYDGFQYVFLPLYNFFHLIIYSTCFIQIF